MYKEQKTDREILNHYLPKLRKRLTRITEIDMTYVPPVVLRYASGEPYAIIFDTTDDNHYHYDIQRDELSDVRNSQ